MFNSLFLTGLIIFFLGFIYKVSNWFIKNIATPGQTIPTSQRVRSAAGGILGVVFSAKLLIVFKVILVDVLLQGRVFKEDATRWLAHMLIFYGFMLLLIMHALDSVVTEALFSDYYATVNPFFFLRDLFGAMVIVGVVMAVFRRYLLKTPRLRTGPKDHYAIIILAVVMFSGIALEGLKITSHSEFIRMVEDYAGLDDEEEIQALEAVWVDDFGVVSPNIQGPFDDDLLSVGREVHEGNCLDCHASAEWAFTGFAMAKIIKPVAVRLDQADGTTILWYIHIIACFAGLAYLPFSKMFHIFAVPLSLIAGQVMDPKRSLPANILTRQMVELDACTHCGSCSLHCSAGMVYEAFGNEYILPSEKITFLKKMVSGRPPDDTQMKAIQQGVYLCTNCDRCTVRCPSGIQLKELWYAVREELLLKGPPLAAILTPFSFARGLLIQPKLHADDYTLPVENAVEEVAGQFAELMKPDAALSLNTQPANDRQPILKDRTFSHCFSCQSCTTVCPVVDNYDRPEQVLGLLPHQIMGCLGLGLTQMAAGAKMIWDCLTCYKCQENCPQEVEVCDLLFDLKNAAAKERG
jgi:heterodisulfide reductase subunit C/nitrate reductase gamma subunit